MEKILEWANAAYAMFKAPANVSRVSVVLFKGKKRHVVILTSQFYIS